MANTTSQVPQVHYDPRWFIWTIVFLVVTGISLVSYIVLSDNGNTDGTSVLATPRSAVHKSVKK